MLLGFLLFITYSYDEPITILKETLSDNEMKSETFSKIENLYRWSLANTKLDEAILKRFVVKAEYSSGCRSVFYTLSSDKLNEISERRNIGLRSVVFFIDVDVNKEGKKFFVASYVNLKANLEVKTIEIRHAKGEEYEKPRLMTGKEIEELNIRLRNILSYATTKAIERLSY